MNNIPIFHPNFNYYKDYPDHPFYSFWNIEFMTDNILDYGLIMENSKEIHVNDCRHVNERGHVNEREHVNERGEVSEENTNNKNECSDVEKMEIINNLWVSSCILYERKWDVIIIINDTKIDNLPKDILIFQELDVDKNIKLIHNFPFL